jgi:3-oxoacyl-[acyl-carrier-protein] synthase III
VTIAAAGVLTGWGHGLAALPDDAGRAAAGRRVLSIPRPALAGDRFRRATRECLLGVAAVEAMLADGGLTREAIAGTETGLVYVTAAAYGAANASFVNGEGQAGTLHFPYTAPSAVPAEVAIEFGLRGAYVILLGGASTAIEALWQAGLLVRHGRCAQALVLAVETFEEWGDLHERARRLAPGPLVEAAACVLVTSDGATTALWAGGEASRLETEVQARAGETLACGPLIALALARARGQTATALTGRWRGRRARLEPDVAGQSPR